MSKNYVGIQFFSNDSGNPWLNTKRQQKDRLTIGYFHRKPSFIPQFWEN